MLGEINSQCEMGHLLGKGEHEAEDRWSLQQV